MEGRVALPKGTLLDNSYRIERVIGSGGFGVTYQAEDVKLATKVAIKEYYPGDFSRRDDSLSVRPTSEKQKATFEWGRSSFLEEARTLARFRHPSVVRVTRVFEAYSTAYMVMEFEQGQSLESWLKRLGQAPTQEELDRIVAPLLDALEMMHAQSFLHRDIAPDNIIVRGDGTPVLLDFGAARRAVAEMSRALTGIVKAGYSPPEQYATDARLQGPWSDIYALGATLYRAVTGKAPEESTLRREDDRTPPAAQAARGGLYRAGFLAAIDACLRVERAQRPQSVGELRPMLLPPPPASKARPVAGAKGRSTVAAPVTFPVSPKRRAWPLVLATTLVVLGGATAGFQYSRWSGGERSAVPADPPRKGYDEAEAAGWAAVKDSTSIPALEAYVKRFPASFFSDLARVRITELKQQLAEREAKERAEAARKKAEAEALAAWEAVKGSTSIAEIEAFLRRYPDSRHAEPARARIAELKKPPCDGIIATVGAAEKRCLNTRETFKDCSECPEMVVVPAGEFTMGSPAGEADRSTDEGPQRTVRIARPFAVGKFEVTFAEWDACVAAGGCNHRPEDRGWGRGKRPVINVSWEDAKAYAVWLSKATGKTYRLLTEAEWEYAARAGTTTPFSTGATITTYQANFDGNYTYGGSAKGEYRQRTVEVGSFQPNAFGLYDMHGNVWEWVEDCYKDSYAGAPVDGSAVTSGDCSRRVLRGGSWFDDPRILRSASRTGLTTGVRYNLFGFRVGRTF